VAQAYSHGFEPVDRTTRNNRASPDGQRCEAFYCGVLGFSVAEVVKTFGPELESPKVLTTFATNMLHSVARRGDVPIIHVAPPELAHRSTSYRTAG